MGGLAQIGRYFQLVSIIPASVVVLATVALTSAGAPGTEPTAHRLTLAVDRLTLQGSVCLALAIVVVGMTMHPFQRAATQVLEGYWGPSRIGRLMMFSRARIHADRRRRLSTRAEKARRSVDYLNRLAEGVSGRNQVRHLELLRLQAEIDFQELETASRRYPDQERVMPTRLGNTLRRYEDRLGSPFGYGTGGSAVIPHLLRIADSDHVAQVHDSRLDLDLAVRFSISWLLLAVVTFVLLWPYDFWLILPIIAYGLAWVSYRAACHAAEEYGSSLLVLFDLNHHLLAERIHAPQQGIALSPDLLIVSVDRMKPDQLSTLVQR
jgi:hypothetical protein